MNIKIYLDDIRTPLDTSWVVVRDFDDFVKKVSEFGFEAIGFGSNKLDVKNARHYLAQWNALSKEEQEALLASRR